jgi:hypothetical protein
MNNLESLSTWEGFFVALDLSVPFWDVLPVVHPERFWNGIYS